MASYFDQECRERYGSYTCIFFETSKNRFEVRLLDGSQDPGLIYFIDRMNLVEMIPKMLVNRYTVVIVEEIRKTKEITAVHLPMQSQLNTPPILQ
ncbi:MAG: hypothetical protein EBU90_13785 [Proteobacteria bacterium]|nr:hypothetical protein [Pseudomonadota bacterium]NBP13574.1 hypothetical protein [bacterium]